MEATYTSETSVDLQRTTRRYISEDRILHNHRCKYLKSYPPSYLISILIASSHLRLGRPSSLISPGFRNISLPRVLHVRMFSNSIMAYLLKVRTVEPDKTALATERLWNNIRF
jgi:hypothetical protein